MKRKTIEEVGREVNCRFTLVALMTVIIAAFLAVAGFVLMVALQAAF